MYIIPKKYTVRACADLLRRLDDLLLWSESAGKQRPKAGAGRVHSLRDLFVEFAKIAL